MIDPRENELRQIKRILIAILVCVAIIAFALVPRLLPVALFVGAIYVCALFGSAMRQTFGITLRQIWAALSTLWRN